MKSSSLFLVALIFIAVPVLNPEAFSQSRPGGGASIVPKSSIQRPQDAGKRAHTNIEIAVPPKGVVPFVRLPSTPGGFFETPASIACVYKLTKAVTGCNPSTITTLPNGGFGAIALIDAYDDPNAASDLANFDSEFGLPRANFTVVYENGVQPPQDSTGGWESEQSIDIEMAHAMAPRAKIYLVEAQSSGFSDLFTALQQANTLVTAAGGGEISMSWGSGEFDGENGYDSDFDGYQHRLSGRHWR